MGQSVILWLISAIGAVTNSALTVQEPRWTLNDCGRDNYNPLSYKLLWYISFAALVMRQTDSTGNHLFMIPGVIAQGFF